VALPSDLQTIKNYIKNINNINSNNISTPQLPQSKSYLKIIGIPYLIENINIPINFSVVKAILKNNYIFNNIFLASKSWVIKASPKSDIVII